MLEHAAQCIDRHRIHCPLDFVKLQAALSFHCTQHTTMDIVHDRLDET